MVRMVSKRAIKGKPKKRGLTYAEKMYQLSANQLLELLATSPDMVKDSNGEMKKSPIKILARKYLNIIYNMSNEKIDMHIKKKQERYKRLEDIGKYYRGEKTPEEVAIKWAPSKEGYSPQSVHSDAKKIHRFEIPAGQKPIIASNPVLHKIYMLGRAAERGEISYEVIQDYLLDLAYERPEFAANIAHMLFTEDSNRYIFKGKKGAELKRKFEDLITERDIDFRRKHPEFPKKDVLPVGVKGLFMSDYTEGKRKQETNSSYTPPTHGFENVKFPKDMYERKKKKAKIIAKRKPRKVIKGRKPIKKCRCRK